VLEVGLGGRLDATNVVAAPIAVITGIALDHQAILGPTREDIAREKAGIFKAGQRVVISRSGDPMVRPQLVEAAERAGAVAITIPDWDAIERVPPLGLEGAHQRRNGAAALAALAYLEELGAVHVEPAAAAQALVHVRHPGRFEWLADDVVADGAHNPDGAAALASLLYHYVETPKAMVVAVSADKDVAAIVDQLAGEPIAFIATRYQQERAMDPEALAELFRAKVPEMRVETAPDLATALARARELAEMVVICGSLFLVGEARTLLLGAPTDPIVVSDPAPTTA